MAKNSSSSNQRISNSKALLAQLFLFQPLTFMYWIKVILRGYAIRPGRYTSGSQWTWKEWLASVIAWDIEILVMLEELMEIHHPSSTASDQWTRNLLSIETFETRRNMCHRFNCLNKSRLLPEYLCIYSQEVADLHMTLWGFTISG